MAEYILAIKRDSRRITPPDWLDRVGRVAGVTVLSSSSKRVRINAGQAALGQLERDFGAFCHIEPVIEHHTLHS